MKKQSIWIAIIVVGVVGIGAVLAWRANSRLVNALVVNIEDKYLNEFVTEKDIEEVINKSNLCRIGVTRLDEIDLREVETRVKAYNFVADCHASKDLRGNLVLDVKQNRPLARIIRPNQQSEYLAINGLTMPLSKKYTARVVVVIGEGTYKLKNDYCVTDSTGKQFYDFLQYIDKNSFWKAQITQIELSKKQEIAFYTQAGNQRIEIGRPDNVAAKLDKLMTFYKEIVPVKGWQTYQRINVAYEKQIICE